MSQGSKAIQKARKRGVWLLAWCSLALATLGGNAAAGTPIGEFVRFLAAHQPWKWLPVLLLIAAVVGTAIDLIVDGTPNQVALYSMIASPSIASAVPGKFGELVTDWSNTAMGWANDALVEYLGTGSAVGITLACIVASLLMARRVIRKSAGFPAGA